jgi:short-subunit dehydrogenase
MRQQRTGHVFTISSLAGTVGVTGSGTYSASKFAVEGWMESLASEVAAFGIKRHPTNVPDAYLAAL